MHVLLINPRITSSRKARFPLSILNIGAALPPHVSSFVIDGNIDPDATATACARLQDGRPAVVGITVMGGPQLVTAIAVSRGIKSARPDVPIVWGGYFPTLFPEVALNCDYVDYVIRGQGEQTFTELLSSFPSPDKGSLSVIHGLSWKDDEVTVHNTERAFVPYWAKPSLIYSQLPDPSIYAVKSFLGNRTVGHQAAIGCRYRCTFCGVAAAFRGNTTLPTADRLDDEIRYLRELVGADSIQFYDHNFFDREADTVPLLDVLARHQLPWWCYARSDALLNLSPSSWELVRKSRLRMAYIGAETPNDELLRSIRKGTRMEQTLEVTELCRRNGVIPELSFMVAPPEDPEGETERTFNFIRKIKRINAEAEIIIYFYTPLPPDRIPSAKRSSIPPLCDVYGRPIQFPRNPDEWTETRWQNYACHQQAPWVDDKLRQKILDFVTVLGCRFPTAQDTESPKWAKAMLKSLAKWRYASKNYDHPWELSAASKLIGLIDPRATSL